MISYCTRTWLVRTSLLAVVVLCLARTTCGARQDPEDDEGRLLLSVRKPTLLVENTTFDSLTVGFYTGPNLLPYEYEVKCVPENSTCLADSAGKPISGVLPSTFSYMTATVTGLAFDTTYWCYVSSSYKKVSKCQGPFPGTTGLPQGALVGFKLLYQRLTSFFTASAQEQVCRNMLALVPNGTCAIDSVANGTARSVSSEVSGSVQYDDYISGQRLYNELVQPTNSTLETLATNIVNSSSEVSVLSVSFDYVVKTPEPGPPGFVMAPVVDVNNATITWLDGKVGDPVETYSVNCVASATASCTDSGIEVTGIARGTEVAMMTGLAANTTYSCWVKASNQAGGACSSAPAVFTTLIAPTAPTNVQEAALSNTTATIAWDDGLVGNPTETYAVKCVVPSGGASSCTQPGNNVTGIARGTQIGTVAGLTPNTEYHCYVIASNSVDDACSTGYASVRTWIEAGEPVCVVDNSVSNTTATIDWQDGTEGNPTETYTVNCVPGLSGTCLDPSGITTGAVNITRGVQRGTVEGLTPNTTYDCFVQAINPVETVCGDSPVQITTWIEPGAPSNVGTSLVQTQAANVTWDDGARGNPGETYAVNCVLGSGSTSCTDAGIDVTGIARGVGIVEVTGLTSNTTYSCWVKASNQVGEVCSSAPTVFTTLIAAGAPTSVVSGTVTTTSVPFTWVDGAVGNPEETYTIICSTNTQASSCVSPGGTVAQETNIARGTQQGTVSGMIGDTEYACWVKAVNTVGETCSNKTSVTTAPDLVSGRVIALNQSISINPPTFTAPSGASNVTYQVQCLGPSATACDPQATGTGALYPPTAQSSPSPITVSGLTDDQSYQCFSVASYLISGQTVYACSGPFEAKPFTKPDIETLIFGNQTVVVGPSTYTAPNGATNVKYQAQCGDTGSSVCDPLATGTAALQPSTASASNQPISVSGLTNDVNVKCYVVVTYTLGSSGTKYTCSDGALSVATANVPILPTTSVIAGNQKITVTPLSYSGPTNATNVSYQVQCTQSILTTCDLSQGVSPATALSSPEPVEFTSLQNRGTYACFSVNSFTFAGRTVYSCSSVFNISPFTQPATLTGSDISAASGDTANVFVASYTPILTATNVKYQAQCLNSTATVCDPAVTSGPGAVAPPSASSSSGTFTVANLTGGTAYGCFSVISYEYNGGLKYTCSEPYQYTFTPCGGTNAPCATFRDCCSQSCNLGTNTCNP